MQRCRGTEEELKSCRGAEVQKCTGAEGRGGAEVQRRCTGAEVQRCRGSDEVQKCRSTEVKRC